MGISRGAALRSARSHLFNWVRTAQPFRIAQPPANEARERAIATQGGNIAQANAWRSDGRLAQYDGEG